MSTRKFIRQKAKARAEAEKKAKAPKIKPKAVVKPEKSEDN